MRSIFSTSNFTIGFYIPHNDPPAPAVDQVYVKEFGSKSVYVRQVRQKVSEPLHVNCDMRILVAPLRCSCIFATWDACRSCSPHKVTCCGEMQFGGFAISPVVGCMAKVCPSSIQLYQLQNPSQMSRRKP